MENQNQSIVGKLCGNSISYMRRFLFDVLSVGPIPNHIAFILDGNRRYARKYKLGEGMGHRAGFLSLMSLMKYCYELGIKYITIYAFSIDNFRRKPHEVQYVMDLMLEKIEGMLKEESIVEQYGVRVYFIGNLKLLDDTVRNAAKKAMKATAKNNKAILLICVAYTSTDEIVHAALESCEQLEHEIGQIPGGAILEKITEITEEKEEKCEEKTQGEVNGEKAEEDKGVEKPGKTIGENVGSFVKKDILQNVSEDIKEGLNKNVVGSFVKKDILQNISEDIKEGLNKSVVGEVKDGILDVISKETKGIRPPVIRLSDIEKNMYMGVAPDVDILVRSSGETRLSNFLLWQTWNGFLYSPKALWPEVGLKHLVWAILNFQRAYPIFEKRKKQF